MCSKTCSIHAIGPMIEHQYVDVLITNHFSVSRPIGVDTQTAPITKLGSNPSEPASFRQNKYHKLRNCSACPMNPPLNQLTYPLACRHTAGSPDPGMVTLQGVGTYPSNVTAPSDKDSYSSPLCFALLYQHTMPASLRIPASVGRLLALPIRLDGHGRPKTPRLASGAAPRCLWNTRSLGRKSIVVPMPTPTQN